MEPRVNGAKMQKFIGRTVRLPCRVLKFQGQDAVVEAADGSQIQVVVSIDSNMNSQYVEIVGQVKDESSIRMLSVLNIGDSMDMKTVNNMIELMHHNEFAGVWH